jgi:hypothetical protein
VTDKVRIGKDQGEQLIAARPASQRGACRHPIAARLLAVAPRGNAVPTRC